MAVTTEKKAKATTKKATPKVSTKKVTTEVAKNADVALNVLVEPWITEKSHKAIADNKYTFKVTRLASKSEVKKAVEGIYNVTVEKVTMVTVKPKKRAYGRHTGTVSGFKKAMLSLKEGDKIEFFQGA